MNKEQKQHIGALFEELENIIISACLGNNKEPVWDGSIIGKPNQHKLCDMGLAEKYKGYYFPTDIGTEIYKVFIKGKKISNLNMVGDDYTKICEVFPETAEPLIVVKNQELKTLVAQARDIILLINHQFPKSKWREDWLKDANEALKGGE